jgi:glycosyltransferase involved in cell wall biosynthesis
MKFYAILCTRDEDDIIEQSLRALTRWADRVYVFDTGSVDQTWDIVQEVSRTNPTVVTVAREPLWFADQVRGYVFDLVRPDFREGDWIARVDSDEFYHVSPPEFVRRHLKAHETCVYHQYYDFWLTKTEARALSSLPAVTAERIKPIVERRRFYIPSLYAEPRLCRYRARMHWPASHTFPVNAGFIAKPRMPIRHYPNRDPLQMQKRTRLRAMMIEAKESAGLFTQVHHWRETDWKQHLVDEDDPRLACYVPGADLKSPGYENHVATRRKRVFQRLLNVVLVPFLDQHRRRQPVFKPARLPDTLQSQLRDEVKQYAVGS